MIITTNYFNPNPNYTQIIRSNVLLSQNYPYNSLEDPYIDDYGLGIQIS